VIIAPTGGFDTSDTWLRREITGNICASTSHAQCTELRGDLGSSRRQLRSDPRPEFAHAIARFSKSLKINSDLSRLTLLVKADYRRCIDVLFVFFFFFFFFVFQKRGGGVWTIEQTAALSKPPDSISSAFPVIRFHCKRHKLLITEAARSAGHQQDRILQTAS